VAWGIVTETFVVALADDVAVSSLPPVSSRNTLKNAEADADDDELVEDELEALVLSLSGTLWPGSILSTSTSAAAAMSTVASTFTVLSWMFAEQAMAPDATASDSAQIEAI